MGPVARPQGRPLRPGRHVHSYAYRCEAARQQVAPPPAHPPAAPAAVLEVSGGRRRVLLLGPSTAADAAAAATLADRSALAAGAAPGGPLQGLVSLFLPRGFPSSVTPDYLPYQLWSVPTHVAGWMSHSLATSSMLQAVGVGVGPAGTAAAAAAIKWITKDGLGAAGRLLVGGRLSSVFDEDPRRWRMLGELCTTAGLALEIATQRFPGSFVVLAGGGTLAKSVGKGLGRPAFRVTQTHFSAINNVGDVAAKEEVWEVVGQLVGLACSVALLRALEAAGGGSDAVVPTWAAVHSVHLALRWRALGTLRFDYPNQKRGAALVSAHVRTRLVPGVDEVNAAEPLLAAASATTPRVVFGCGVGEALSAAPPPRSSGSGSSKTSGGSRSNGSMGAGSMGATSHQAADAQQQQEQQQLAQLLALYSGERYALSWQDGTAYVLLWQDAAPADLLRALWQAAWLDNQFSHLQQQPGSSNGSSSKRSGSGSNDEQGGNKGDIPTMQGASTSSTTTTTTPAAVGWESLEQSLWAAQAAWPEFEQQLRSAGWRPELGVFPQGPTRLHPLGLPAPGAAPPSVP